MPSIRRSTILKRPLNRARSNHPGSGIERRFSRSGNAAPTGERRDGPRRHRPLALTVEQQAALPAGLESTGDPVMDLPWTYAGLPTLTLPAGFLRKWLTVRGCS
ncbi:MAG: hypothetical protein M5U34_19120 [Chloroflexi bacterium]|nr:hypothetical protein [Chloroflexota bacterium]